VFTSHIFRNAAEFLGDLSSRASHVSRHTNFTSCMQALCSKQRSHKLIKLFLQQSGKKEMDWRKIVIVISIFKYLEDTQLLWWWEPYKYLHRL